MFKDDRLNLGRVSLLAIYINNIGLAWGEEQVAVEPTTITHAREAQGGPNANSVPVGLVLVADAFPSRRPIRRGGAAAELPHRASPRGVRCGPTVQLRQCAS